MCIGGKGKRRPDVAKADGLLIGMAVSEVKVIPEMGWGVHTFRHAQRLGEEKARAMFGSRRDEAFALRFQVRAIRLFEIAGSMRLRFRRCVSALRTLGCNYCLGAS